MISALLLSVLYSEVSDQSIGSFSFPQLARAQIYIVMSVFTKINQKAKKFYHGLITARVNFYTQEPSCASQEIAKKTTKSRSRK